MGQFVLGTPTGLISRIDNPITLANSTTETTLLSTMIAGSAMTLKNRLKFNLWCALSTQALVPGTLTIRVKYGSLVLTLGGGALALLGSAASAPFTMSGRLSNKGTTNSQFCYGELRQASGGLSLLSPINQARSTSAIDSTTDQAFSITAQFSVASAQNILVVDDIEVELS